MNDLTIDSPELTAYALGEPVAQDLESAILQDSVLLKEVERIRETEAILLSHFTTQPSLHLDESRKEKVLSETSKIVAFPESNKRVMRKRIATMSYVALSSAAIITLGVMLLKLTPATQREIASQSVELDEFSMKVVIAPAVVPSEEESLVPLAKNHVAHLPKAIKKFSKDELSELAGDELTRIASAQHVENVLAEQSPVPVVDDVRLPVPVTTGIASYNAVKRSLVSGRVPSPEVVRIEELINSYDYKQPIDFEKEGLSAGVSIVECPWNDSAVLVGLLLKAGEGVSALSANVEFQPNEVSKYRLVGYDSLQDTRNSKKLQTFDGSNFVFYEVVPTESFAKEELLSFSINWVSEGNKYQQALSVSGEVQEWENTSEDLRSAVTLTCFSKYLKFGKEFPMSLADVSALADQIQPTDNRFSEGYLLISAAKAVEEFDRLILASPHREKAPKK